MEKEFIPYNESLELKELGFDELCFGWYDNKYKDDINYDRTRNSCGWLNGSNCTAPTFSQAFRFFREKCGLYSYIEPVLVEKANSPIKYDYVILEVSHQNDLEYNNLPYHTFEEAELACLEKLIQIVKDGK